jgi:hypothetical protein
MTGLTESGLTIGSPPCTERGLRTGEVRERPVYPPLSRRVWVGVDPDTQSLGSNVLPPDLRPRQEKALLRGEAVDRGGLPCGRGFSIAA